MSARLVQPQRTCGVEVAPHSKHTPPPFALLLRGLLEPRFDGVGVGVPSSSSAKLPLDWGSAAGGDAALKGLPYMPAIHSTPHSTTEARVDTNCEREAAGLCWEGRAPHVRARNAWLS